MANPYFEFKQFTVFHDRCAMKVGTDSVLLGAWVDPSGAHRILDIGAGSGLLSLMMAQRSDAWIDAVEIEAEACLQAQENIARSPWPAQIRTHQTSIQSYALIHPQRYDLIISNPPFFEPSQNNATPARNTARQGFSLDQQALLEVACRLLHQKGTLAVIYPLQEALLFEKRAQEKGLSCSQKLHIKGRVDRPIRRTMMQFVYADQRNPLQHTTDEQTLVIETGERHQYTKEYEALTRAYYLRFD